MKSVETCTVLKSMLKPVSRSNSDTFPILCQLRRVLRSLIHTTEVGQKRKAIYNVTTVTANPSFDNSLTNLNSSLKRFLVGTFLFYYLSISIVGRISNLKGNKPLENIYCILQYTYILSLFRSVYLKFTFIWPKYRFTRFDNERNYGDPWEHRGL